MLIVQKYGGSSLEDREKLYAAARRVAGLVRQGHRLVVVVSAPGNLTDRLIAAAREIAPRCPAREMDGYLACGEQLSACRMAMALGELGCPAVSLTGWQAGLVTDGAFGNARILGLRSRRIQRELEAGNTVVVTGFQGVSPEGDITTLGRGGSDTTAVALAAELGADRCQVCKDVDGVYDRDPRVHPDAVRFWRLSYGTMLALIRNGARVLHDRSVEIARDRGITIEVCSAFTDAPGTLVGPEP